jgi:hypothetical protein
MGRVASTERSTTRSDPMGERTGRLGSMAPGVGRAARRDSGDKGGVPSRDGDESEERGRVLGKVQGVADGGRDWVRWW